MPFSSEKDVWHCFDHITWECEFYFALLLCVRFAEGCKFPENSTRVVKFMHKYFKMKSVNAY